MNLKTIALVIRAVSYPNVAGLLFTPVTDQSRAVFGLNGDDFDPLQ